MRIIAGALGGRRLAAPRGQSTRPTADRVREALFNILGPPPEGARVLDLCAGAGGLGLEALSRGAAEAVFIEQAPAAVRCLKQNIASLGVEAASRVHAGDARTALRRLSPAFHWVFLDPPYRGPLGGQLLAILGDGRLLAPGAVVVLEHDRRREPDLEVGCLIRTDERTYGDTCVSFYRTGA